jgi:hypothetical protein
MNKKEIFIYFDNFNKYILTKTKNIFGIYFILVKMNISNNGIVEKIKIENINYNVYIIYVNPNFIDYNLFYGDNANELKEILNILEDFFYKL